MIASSAARTAALLLLPLVVVSGRMFLEARGDLAEAARLADRGDPEAVELRIAALGRAARRYLPLGPSATARRTLAELGRREVPGACEELRASILATRWLLTPDAALLRECDQTLATRLATRQIAAGSVSLPDPDRVAELASSEAALLAHHTEPSRPLTFLALLGCGLFLVGVQRALLAPASRRPRLVAALGFVLFVVGLWRA